MYKTKFEKKNNYLGTIVKIFVYMYIFEMMVIKIPGFVFDEA